MNDLTITGWNKEKALLSLFLFIGLVGGAFAFTLSYFSNTNVLIGLCLFPFSFFNCFHVALFYPGSYNTWFSAKTDVKRVFGSTPEHGWSKRAGSGEYYD